MAFNASRGGEKPQMMSGSEPWTILTGGVEKFGIYERKAQFGEVARRVEMPQWLAEERERLGPRAFMAALGSGELSAPRSDIGESGGHIYVSPAKALGFAGSAVGVDEEIYERLRRLGNEFKALRFVGYAPGYRLAFQWRISGADFKEKARRVAPSEKFMPQWMVGISDLSMFISR